MMDHEPRTVSLPTFCERPAAELLDEQLGVEVAPGLERLIQSVDKPRLLPRQFPPHQRYEEFPTTMSHLRRQPPAVKIEPIGVPAGPTSR